VLEGFNVDMEQIDNIWKNLDHQNSRRYTGVLYQFTTEVYNYTSNQNKFGRIRFFFKPVTSVKIPFNQPPNINISLV